MGVGEARSLTSLIRTNVASIREHLLAIYIRRGWESLDYRSWGAYLEGEFPDTSTSYLRRQTHAGLLEADLSSELIGKHKESHLRPISETLGDDKGARALAYYLTMDRTDNPTALDFQRSSWEVYVTLYGQQAIQARLSSGELSAKAAHDLTKLSEQHKGKEDLLFLAAIVSDPELIPLLDRIRSSGPTPSETYWEVYHSLAIPGYPEPIPIERATAANLLAWLDEASAEHRAMARELNKDKYNRKDAALSYLVEAVRVVCNARVTNDAGRQVDLHLIPALEQYEEALRDK